MKLACLVVSLLCASACGDDPPTAPSTQDGRYSGTWAGAIDDPFNGSGTMRLEVTHRATAGAPGAVLEGSWSAAYGNPQRNGSGQIGGLIAGSTASLLATPSPAGSCPQGVTIPPFVYTITATIGDSEIRGSYTFSTCAGVVTGTLALRRQ